MEQLLQRGGLILEEPLLWEKGQPGRSAYSQPRRDVDLCPLPESFAGDAPPFPDLSELELVRHYTRLSTWNFGVDTGTYPLGSCTMKYNPKTHERQAALSGFLHAHPFLPASLCQGILEIIHRMEGFLNEITGMDAVTLQPAAGAHGELAGMLIIHAHHRRSGRQRSKVLVPDTAHGTNPASAALCGYRPVQVTTSPAGILAAADVDRLMDDDTAGIMITNPNTLGLFEEDIREIATIVHRRGGLVYGDGANMNALLGIARPGDMGFDLVHLNLHKTFSAPHGGGGPGAGPVAVKNFLEPFLPVPRVLKTSGGYVLKEDFPDTVGRLLTFYGHVGVLLRAYSYLCSLGPKDLRRVSELAVLNANYLRVRLRDFLHLPYDRPCMHECVFSDRFLQPQHVTTLDVAKRLMDYGFHPPTVYFPLIVAGALMVEPTETEAKEDLDRLIEALRAIVREASEHPELLREAPHVCRLSRLDETMAARNPCLTG